MRSVKQSVGGSSQGFSLVELMIVVAIIGILAGLAVPKFNLFQAKARQAEVKTNLSSIYTLEQSYFGDNSQYLGFTGVVPNSCANGSVIGFTPSPCNKLRYSYSVVTSNNNSAFTANGVAPLQKIYPGCKSSGSDTWQIDQEKNLDTVPSNTNALIACGGG